MIKLSARLCDRTKNRAIRAGALEIVIYINDLRCIVLRRVSYFLLITRCVPIPGSISSIYAENPYFPSFDFALATLYFLLIFLNFLWIIPPFIPSTTNPRSVTYLTLLFNCPKLSSERAYLISLFHTSNIPFNTKHIFSSPQQPLLILSVLSFINLLGFLV